MYGRTCLHGRTCQPNSIDGKKDYRNKYDMLSGSQRPGALVTGTCFGCARVVVQYTLVYRLCSAGKVLLNHEKSCKGSVHSSFKVV